MSPYCLVRRAWDSIPKYTKTQFFSTALFALMIHMYLMTNGLINHDSPVVMLNNEPFYLSAGRWFANAPDLLSTQFNLLWVNSLLAVFYMSVAACAVGACLQLRRTLPVLVLSALFAAFPAVACILSYRQDSDLKFFAVMLACLAVAVTGRFRFGFLGGIALLIMSLATYQANVGFFAGVAVLVLIRQLLSGTSIKAVLKNALRLAVGLIGGLVGYVVSVKMTYHGSGPGYKDIDTLAGFSLSELPRRIGFAYSNFFGVFFKNSLSIQLDPTQNDHRLTYLFIVAMLIVLCLLAAVVVRKGIHKDLPRLALVVVLVGLIPLGLNAIALFSPDYLYLLMQYSLVLVFAFALVVVDLCAECGLGSSSRARSWLASLGSWVVILFCCVMAFCYALYSNVFYLKMDLINRQGQAYSTALVARIQSTPHYTSDTPIVLFGGAPQTISLGYFENYFAIPIEDMPNMYSYSTYLVTYLDFRNPVVRNDSSMPPELAADAQAMRVISDMPNYPDDGSVEAVDGFIVVKLSN